MPSNPKWRPTGQWLFVSAIIALSALYIAQPERQTFPQILLSWYQILTVAPYDEPPPQPALTITQHPLLEYDTLLFLGCDLTIQAGELRLVTQWAGDLPTAGYMAHFRFYAPNGSYLTTYTQPITIPMLNVPLPHEFYEASDYGQIWLQVMNPASGLVLPSNMALYLIEEDGWRKICS